MTLIIKKKADLEQEALENWRASCKVTANQAKLALLDAGLLDDVEAIMEDPETDRRVKIAWANASFERDSNFIAQMAQTLGLTDEQVDDLFKAAQNITI